MKAFSVKFRIAVWLTLLMGLLAVLLLVFMLSISKAVAAQASMAQLAQTVRSNLSQTGLDNGRLTLGDGFRFYQNGAVLGIPDTAGHRGRAENKMGVSIY